MPGRHVQTVTLSHNYLNNRNLKYLRNDDSSEDNLTLRLRSVEQKTTLRAENRTYLGRWTVREGVEVNYSDYTNRTLQRLYTDRTQLSDYRTRLGIVGWGLFAGAEYASADKRFTASAGLRADGCDYSATYGAGVAPAVAPGFGLLCGRSRLVGERQRGTLLPAAALHGVGIQGGRRAGQPIARLHARRGLQRGCRLAAARPADRLGRGILQTLRRCAAVGGGRDSALVQGQRLRRGGQREAGLLGARGAPTASRRWPAGRFRGE